MLALANRPVRKARIGILGFTFKENIPDIRNSKVLDIFQELKEFGIVPMVHDPMAEPANVAKSCGFELSDISSFKDLDALVVAVSHQQYLDMDPQQFADMLVPDGVLIDVKNCVDADRLPAGIHYWSL
jgi:UDP-N-acetyl-D-galactosamine dehydrogenase